MGIIDRGVCLELGRSWQRSSRPEDMQWFYSPGILIGLQHWGVNWRRRFGVQVRVLQKDLAKPSAPKEVFDELERDSIPVSILVNNAGFGLVGAFAEQPIATDLEMLQVNVGAW